LTAFCSGYGLLTGCSPSLLSPRGLLHFPPFQASLVYSQATVAACRSYPPRRYCLQLPASSEMHPRMSSTCCFHVDCLLMRADDPPPHPKGCHNPEEALAVVQSPAERCRRRGGCLGTWGPMLLRGLASWQARRLAASRNSIANGTSGRRRGGVAGRWRGTLCPAWPALHCAGRPKVPSPMAHPFHAHCPLALGWTAFCTRQRMVPVRIPLSGIPPPSRRRTFSPSTTPPTTGMS